MSKPRPRILLVDDDSMTRELLSRTLERHGFEIIEGRDGHEALQLVETARPALVVLDYEMPDLNGAQVCELVRQHRDPLLAELPIILLTAHAGVDHEIESLEAGANDFVTKPINIHTLKARLDTQLRLGELRDQLQRQNTELEKWRHEHERDLESASLTQTAILPHNPPPIDGWEVAAYYQPVIQVGGDIFDWLRLRDGGWLFWIADATGHGVSAALLTALTKLLFRHAAGESESPAAVLRAVNAEFSAIFKGRSFMTAACVAIRAGNDRVRFAGAGHPPLFVVRNGGKVEEFASQVPPLGITPELAAREVFTAIHPGDTLLLSTDGIFSPYGADGERLTPEAVPGFFPAYAASAHDFLDATVASLTAMHPPPLPDDLAAICLRRL
jgi:serine phosphatase RsbU (regulator of sigma subunit)